ncbi:MAG TPA: DUF1592 domain-containing protein [Planctomycetaceae bacterium]|nr:DUF1592 domain-containing protein [Planctomycetaceae bacterium]
MSRCLFALFATAWLATSVIAQEARVPVDAAGYQRTITPFFAKYCGQCHTGDKPEGEFAVDAKRLANDFGDPAAKAKWREVMNVLNSHEMPPEKEKQPSAAEVATIVDWITEQAVHAELARREGTAVLRRLNRDEYRNTIRDLVGVDFDISGFPQEGTAGGFDNNGGALTISPLLLETYLSAAQQILDRALVEGDRPETIKWRFDPKAGAMDRTRLRLDARNNPIVNGNNNQQEGDWVVVHHNSWDKGVGARDFRVPTAGLYAIRIRAAGRRPTRAQVVESAAKILKYRQDEQDVKNPKGKEWTQRQYDRDLAHFQTDRMYDYGPPRIKLNVQLGSLPRTIAEFDADGSPDAPRTHEILTRFTTETAGIGIEYAYAIPRVVENFALQNHDTFARPELLIDWIELEGPLHDAWPPGTHTRLLPQTPKTPKDEARVAREALQRFMRRAYRRPVTADEVTAKLAFFTAARSEKSLVESVKQSLLAVLVSPHFLFMIEPASLATPLDDHQLATRLSYFLWSTMPDDELFQLADAGKLRDPAVRRAQVDRMLKDPKSTELVQNFAGQWLGLRDVGANPPAMDLYPQYDRHLETSIVAESEAYFAEFLQHDLDARQMIRSDFVTINERLARFYGIDNVRGDEFRRVPVPMGVQRGGIVTQASILTTTSNGTRTSPVKRGTWILKTLLGTDPGLPVANAGEIAPKVPGIDKATVRQRLEIHRELPQCARCHSKIDPLGFALENYNAAGEWRDREGFGYKGRIEQNDPKIDTSSKMPDGTQILGVAGLQRAMLAQEDLFLGALSSRVLTYACGRELGLADQPTVKAAVVEMKRNQYTLRSLLKFIVSSEAFTTK